MGLTVVNSISFHSLFDSSFSICTSSKSSVHSSFSQIFSILLKIQSRHIRPDPIFRVNCFDFNFKHRILRYNVPQHCSVIWSCPKRTNLCVIISRLRCAICLKAAKVRFHIINCKMWEFLPGGWVFPTPVLFF